VKMIFIFIDGFGIGKEDASVNPLANPELPNINYILNKAGAIPTDACLDVPACPRVQRADNHIYRSKCVKGPVQAFARTTHNYTEEDDN